MRNWSICLLLLSIFQVGCSKQSELKISGAEEKSVSFNAVVSNVQIENNQLKIQGISLKEVKTVVIKNDDGFNESFEIESLSNNELIANGLKNVSFLIGKAFTLIVSNAYGSASFDISFTLQDGAVTASKLSDMGAADGDVLIYNQTDQIWEPRPLSGLNLKGTWDADTNSPLLGDGGSITSPLSGDYYVVSISGTTTIDTINTWNDGDWIIFNGTVWDRIQNSSEITSFNTRTGAVVPEEGDYDLDDLGDVDLTTAPTNGQVLKFDGVKWAAADDEVSTGGGSGTGEATNVILNADSDGDNNGEIQFKVNSDTKAVIDNNGNFALGSSSASAKLDVFGNSGPLAVFDMIDNQASNFVLKQNTDEYLNVNTTDGSESITFGNTTTNPDFIFMGGNLHISSEVSPTNLLIENTVGNSKLELKNGNANSYNILNMSSDDSLRFQENGASVITLKGGNVGIGTTSPQQILHIHHPNGNPNSIGLNLTAGTGTAGRGVHALFNGRARFGYEGNSVDGVYEPGVIISDNGTSKNTYIRKGPMGDYTDNQVVINSNGLGIGGMFEAAGKLDIGDVLFDQGTGNCPVGYTELDYDGQADSADCKIDYLLVTSNGNVGLGTTNPSYRLDVDGIVSADGLKFLKKSQKTFNITFTEGVSDEKVQVYLPTGTRLQGTYTVTVTVGYNFANCSGSISKRFHGYGRTNGNFSGKHIEVPFAAPLTKACYTISDPQWDAANTRWYFVIASLNGRGNNLSITLESLAGDSAGNASDALLSSLYTDDPTLFDSLEKNYFGNVGIGVTSPTEKVDVDGNVKATAFIGDGSQLTGVGASSTSNTGEAVIESDSDASGDETITFKTAGTTKATIDNSGNFNLGANLGFGSSELAFSIGNGSAPAVLALGEDTNNNSLIKWDNTNDALSFGTKVGGTEYSDTLVIKDGRVGVGTTSPTSLVDIENLDSGAVTTLELSSSGNTSYLYSFASDNASPNMAGSLTLRTPNKTIVRTDATNGGAFELWAGGVSSTGYRPFKIFTESHPSIATMVLGHYDQTGSAAGRIGKIIGPSGAGTDEAGGSLVLSGGGSTGSASGGSIRFQTTEAGASGVSANSFQERMRIDANGNVGIGTVNPAEKLDVVGSVKMNVGGSSFSLGGTGAATYNIGTGVGSGTISIGGAAQSGALTVGNSTGTNTLNLGIGSGTGTVNIATGGTNPKIINIGSNDTVSNTISIGGNNSETLFSGSVGIGTTSPTNALHITEKDDNWTSGLRMDRSYDSTTDYFQMMYDYEGFKLRTMADGTDEAHIIFKPLDSEAMRITEDGDVGIGTSSPATMLQVEGVISPATDNSYTLGNATYRFTEVYAANGVINTSDARAKMNITGTDLGLEFISKLKPVSYQWKDGIDKDVYYGFLAQDIERLILETRENEAPTSIVTYDESSDRYGVRYTELIAPLIKAFQELYEMVTGHSEKIESQTQEISSLKEENKQMKKYLCQKDPKAPFCK